MSRRAGNMVGSAVRRGAVWLATFAVASATFSTSAFAHAGSLAGLLRPAPAPFWFVAPSGGTVCVSLLLSASVTDDETLDTFEYAGVRIGGLAGVVVIMEAALKLLGAAALVLVVAFRLLGPPVGIANLGVLFVWVGWWVGFTMAAYLVGNTWPLVSPWRTPGAALQDRFATGGRLSRPYPDRLGSWPNAAGLLGLVWLGVVSPLAANPQVLAVVVVAYGLVTVGGAVVYDDAWFRHTDPVARVFRLYGLLVPVRRGDDGGLSTSVPGAGLTRSREWLGVDGVAFVVALLWVTTFDGLVVTAAWRGRLRCRGSGPCAACEPRRGLSRLPRRLPTGRENSPWSRGYVRDRRLCHRPVRARVSPHRRRLSPRAFPRPRRRSRARSGRGRGLAAVTAREPLGVGRSGVVQWTSVGVRCPRPPAFGVGHPRPRVRPLSGPPATVSERTPFHRRHGRLHDGEPVGRRPTDGRRCRWTSRRTSRGMSREVSIVVPETAVPDDEIAATTCPCCDRPLRRERLRDLHVGDAHEDPNDSETTAYEAAVEAGAEDLLVYHLKAAGAFGVVFTASFLLAIVGFSLWFGR